MEIKKVQQVLDVINNNCKHSWVYENSILCSNPPKQRKICQICGKVEIEKIDSEINNITFNELMIKFKKE